MRGVRGSQKDPGEFRRSQNWIGGTRPGNAQFVPPPPQEMKECLHKLEEYFHQTNRLDPLICCALIHVQFETIHPFLDGNGRLGRLLIILLGLLKNPSLYLSLFFKRHQEEYYRRLNAVRKDGDWEEWVGFFLEGIGKISSEQIETAQQLFKLHQTHRTKILRSKKTSIGAVQLFEILPTHPMVTISRVVKLLRTTKPTASKVVSLLTELQILKEVTQKRRDKIFLYKTYVDILRKDT